MECPRLEIARRGIGGWLLMASVGLAQDAEQTEKPARAIDTTKMKKRTLRKAAADNSPDNIANNPSISSAQSVSPDFAADSTRQAREPAALNALAGTATGSVTKYNAVSTIVVAPNKPKTGRHLRPLRDKKCLRAIEMRRPPSRA